MPTAYEYRQHDNPRAMPKGTATISTHRTLEAAERASIREQTRLRSQTPSGSLIRPFLQRIIVEVDADGRDGRIHDAPAYDPNRGDWEHR